MDSTAAIVNSIDECPILSAFPVKILLGALAVTVDVVLPDTVFIVVAWVAAWVGLEDAIPAFHAPDDRACV